MALSNHDRGILLLSARESIMTLFSDIPVPSVKQNYSPALKEPGGAFVTLTKEGNLRGCIGYIDSDDMLFNTVCDAARLAASEDPRFPPVDEMEMPRIMIEISVLSKSVLITSYDEIELGRHGLILEEPNARGLLLPQVAVEHKMSLEQFLTSLCRKAGLRGSEWRTKLLKIKSFTAEVFGEQIHRNLTGEIL